MGSVNTFTQRLRQAGTVGLDTSVFIYAFERHPNYGPLAQALFRAIEGGSCRGCVSVLALGEVLTGVKKMQNPGLLLRYRDVFQHFPGLTLYDADVAVMEKMSDLRARYSIRTPDAIHLGTALAQGVRAFVTNDTRLRQVTEIEILLLSKFA